MTNSQLWQPVVWQPQQLLADGRYIITGILGDGGCGRTYKATDKKTGKTFAIKTCPLHFMGELGRAELRTGNGTI